MHLNKTFKKRDPQRPPFNLTKLQKYLETNLIISHMQIMAYGSGLALVNCPFSTIIQDVARALDSNYSPDPESDVASINLQSAAGVTCRGRLYSEFFQQFCWKNLRKCDMASQMIPYYSLLFIALTSLV